MENFGSLIFLVLIAALFIPVFLTGRKQKRAVAEMQALQQALEPGDVVVTTSGLRGVIVDASYEETVDLEIADGIVTTWVRGAIREKVLPDAEPDTETHDADAAVEKADTTVADADTTGSRS